MYSLEDSTETHDITRFQVKGLLRFPHAMRQKVGRYQKVKRLIDILGVLFSLPILLPLLAILALCIFIEDRGPIFYKQQRVGIYGQPFYIYKLRSMIKNADAYLIQHPTLLRAWKQNGKIQHDPRVTCFGRLLRRTSLDELPQIVNVLRGEMSLVGPRAIQFSEVAAFGELNALRQQVKPGLTGLWQISGRSHINYVQRCLLDCIYVMDRSLWVDMHIICKTLPAVMSGDGAF